MKAEPYVYPCGLKPGDRVVCVGYTPSHYEAFTVGAIGHIEAPAYPANAALRPYIVVTTGGAYRRLAYPDDWRLDDSPRKRSQSPIRGGRLPPRVQEVTA